MWEAIKDILMSKNAFMVLCSIGILLLVASVLARLGIMNISTKYISFGMSDSDKERTIIREQCNWVHTYLRGLEGKISMMTPEMKYNGYFTKYILEVIYDEIVKWITFNHIEDTERYISVKQDIVSSIVYSMGVQEAFKTKEFNNRMRAWVAEVIEKLLEIRRLYS